MYERNQPVAFQITFSLNEFQFFFLKMKKIDKFGLSQIYGSNFSFVYFEMLFLKI